MKNIFKYLLCFMMLLCLCTSVYAQGDVSGIVSGNQDHLMLATVVDITDTSIILAPHQLIYIDSQDEQSTFLNENISVDKFRYSYCADHSDISTSPRVGDNIFISLDNVGARYVMKNGAYKVSSVDYKMLTFYASESMRGEGCLADIVSLAYFVRTNGAMRRFRFENGVLTADSDGNKLTLYPTENITDTVTFLNIDGKVVDAAETEDVIIHGEERSQKKNTDHRWLISYAIIILGVVVGGVVVYNMNYGFSISKKSQKEKK